MSIAVITQAQARMNEFTNVHDDNGDDSVRLHLANANTQANTQHSVNTMQADTNVFVPDNCVSASLDVNNYAAAVEENDSTGNDLLSKDFIHSFIHSFWPFL